MEGEGGGEVWEQGAVEEEEGGLRGDGLGEGDGVVGVFVACSGGGEGVEGDLLDGTVGVEDGSGDGVVGAGAPGEEWAGDGLGLG